MGDNIILGYLEALPAVFSASRWFVQKLQGCVAGIVVVQLCILCRDSSRLPPCSAEFVGFTVM